MPTTDPAGRAIKNLITRQRITNGLQRETRRHIRRLIDATAAELARIDPTGVAARYQKARLERLLKRITVVGRTHYAALGKFATDFLIEWGSRQADWALLGLPESAGSVAVSSVREVVRSDAMHGDTLREWTRRAELEYLRETRRVVRRGTEAQAALGTMVSEVRGPVARKLRRSMDGIARTAITHVSNRAHMLAYEQNADVVSGVEYVATLDLRTTEICARWDGTVWKNGDPRIQVPPLHFNCRSQLVPVVDYEGLGIKPPTEGTRASVDGQVPASTRYEQWLRRRSPADQAAVLGAEKARRFRNDGLTLRDLITQDNRVLTLDDLDAR